MAQAGKRAKNASTTIGLIIRSSKNQNRPLTKLFALVRRKLNAAWLPLPGQVDDSDEAIALCLQFG